MCYKNVAPPRRNHIQKQQFTTRITLLRSLNARVPLYIQAPEFLCHFQRTQDDNLCEDQSFRIAAIGHTLSPVLTCLA